MSAAGAIAMTPFFFGGAERRLFGSHHAPAGGRGRRHAVVVCPPIGQEHVRSQRGLWRLAVRLADEGFHTLRFDLYGTGDSGGESADGDVRSWTDDLARAIAAVRARSGAPEVCLVGLRLGAALAAMAAAGRDDVDTLVLWEPVVDGSEYLEELDDRHRSYMARFPAPLSRRRRSQPNGEALGFALGRELRGEIASIDLRALSSARARSVLVLEGERTGARAGEREAALASLGAGVKWDRAADERIWIEDINRMVVPERAIDRIVSWLAETCR